MHVLKIQEKFSDDFNMNEKGEFEMDFEDMEMDDLEPDY
jgi:hypothetical protein